MQKSLQGLDNVIAQGTEAIDDLTQMIETLVKNGAGETWRNRAKRQIKEVKGTSKLTSKHIRVENTVRTTVRYILLEI